VIAIAWTGALLRAAAPNRCVPPRAGTWRVAARTLQRGGERTDVEVAPRLVVSELDMLHAVVLGDLGIALLPAYQCVDDVRAKRLERVLREWEAPPTPIHLMYPSRRHVSPTVKSFIEHVQEQMTPRHGRSGPCPELRASPLTPGAAVCAWRGSPWGPGCERRARRRAGAT
jgi:DNA-binding transcriptional LysR family regulator